MKLVVPNLITVSRLLLMPLGLYFLSRADYPTAFGTYLLIALTDYWDGLLARKWNACSSLGIILDQIADKCVGLGFFFGLTLMGLCPPWFLVFLILITVLLGLGYLLTQFLPAQAGPQNSLPQGKWSTALQYVWVGWLILSKIIFKESSTPVLLPFFNTLGFCTLSVFQGYVFIKYFNRFLKEHSWNLEKLGKSEQ